MGYLYSASNFSCIVAGLFNFMPLKLAHIFFLGMSALFNILVIINQSPIAIGFCLFMMNISQTGILTSALALLNQTKLFEANSVTYLSMLVADLIALVPNALGVPVSNLTDCIIYLPCFVI